MKLHKNGENKKNCERLEIIKVLILVGHFTDMKHQENIMSIFKVFLKILKHKEITVIVQGY